MAETLLSPGVLARENDQSFLQNAPLQAGAAIIGPTVKGPLVPTLVTTYSDYVNRFGSAFLSGSNLYTYFTSIAAFNYFSQGGTSLLVGRVVPGREAWSNATSSWTPVTGAYANVFASSSTTGMATLGAIASASGSGIPYLVFANGGTGAGFSALSASQVAEYSAPAFVLETLPYGDIMNDFQTPVNVTSSIFGTAAAGALYSGSSDNVRFQIVGSNVSTGTFSLLIRQGNDNDVSQTVLETYSNVSLDPTQPNYIERVIGNQTQTIVQDPSTGGYYVQTSGSFPNISRYVRVKQVNYKTPNYFDNTGTAKSQYTGSIPLNYGGVFGGATGDMLAYGTGSSANSYYELINRDLVGSTGLYETQGVIETDYDVMLSLLANKEDYAYNILSAPGLTKTSNNSDGTITAINTTVQERGDAIAVLDMVNYNSPIASVATETSTMDTSYAATYWPWLQTADPSTGDLVWVPASTMIPAVYAYNDRTTEPWFAPAGFNRGGITTVTRAERKLSQGDRNYLYENNVNPIATFPNQGIVVFGQKTLQKRASALDRVNVRRLLIQLKNYISQIADNLVFEQNTIATRNRFLSQVNPYLENVQQKQGLYAFKVVMDDSNNTADVIDRNEIVGQIYIQPTRTAEYVLLDFNILPTGATFPTS